MVKPIDPFENVFYINSFGLRKSLETEREDIISLLVTDILENEGLSHIRYQDVDFRIRVDSKQSIEAIADNYYERNNTSKIPEEDEVIDFLLSYPELLDISIVIYDLDETNYLSKDNITLIGNVVSEIIEDTSILKKNYSSLFMDTIMDAMSEHFVPRSFAMDTTVYDIEITTSESELIDIMVSHYNDTYDKPNQYIESINTNIIRNDVVEVIADGHYAVVVHEDKVIFENDEDLIERVNDFKEDFEVDLSYISEIGLCKDAKALVNNEFINSYTNTLLEYFNELATNDARKIASNNENSFIPQIHFPSNMSKINQLAQQLIEENGIYTEEQAEYILYAYGYLHSAILHHAVSIGEIVSTDYSILFDINAEDVRQEVEEVLNEQ